MNGVIRQLIWLFMPMNPNCICASVDLWQVSQWSDGLHVRSSLVINHHHCVQTSPWVTGTNKLKVVHVALRSIMCNLHNTFYIQKSSTVWYEQFQLLSVSWISGYELRTGAHLIFRVTHGRGVADMETGICPTKISLWRQAKRYGQLYDSVNSIVCSFLRLLIVYLVH
jgi:hypothetical protein